MIQVSIVEDDDAFRESLVVLLNGTPGFHCLAGYRSGEEACKALPSAVPDVLLMDINLDGMSGIECVIRLKTILPELQIMMLTVYEESDRIFQALAAGANGYLVKRTPPARLLEAITQITRGESPMSGHIARKIVQSFQHSPRPVALLDLTPTEHTVLDHLAHGALYKEIADLMQISMDTVRTHIRSIYQKLQVHSRTEAVLTFLGQIPRA